MRRSCARKAADELADLAERLARGSRLGLEIELPGPVGERNLYSLKGRDGVLCDASSEEALIAQIACALASGGRAFLDGPAADEALFAFSGLPLERAAPGSHFSAALTDRRGEALQEFAARLARAQGRDRKPLSG